MDRLVVDDIFILGNLVYRKAREGKHVAAVLFYDEATALMRELLINDDVSICVVDIAEEAFDDYNREYIVELTPDLELFVEKAWVNDDNKHGGYYKGFDSDVLLIDGDASSSIIKYQENSDCYLCELDFMDSDDCSECEEPAEHDSTVCDLFDCLVDLFELLYKRALEK